MWEGILGQQEGTIDLIAQLSDFEVYSQNTTTVYTVVYNTLYTVTLYTLLKLRIGSCVEVSLYL